MKMTAMILTALTVTIAPIAGAANPPRAASCPPGLANREPACVPPGQAKHGSYRVGDRIERGYVLIREPRRYGLNPNYTYVLSGGQVYRVDRDTREILDLIGAVAAILD